MSIAAPAFQRVVTPRAISIRLQRIIATVRAAYNFDANLVFKVAFTVEARDVDLVRSATDICFAPVLDLEDAPKHPHNVARETFVTIEGVVQPAPAPRFSATPGAIQGPPPKIGAHNDEALSQWGFSAAEIDALKAKGAL